MKVIEEKVLTEWFETNWGNNSFSECLRCLDSKEAWEKFLFKLGTWPLYKVWFVTVKLQELLTLLLYIDIAPPIENRLPLG